MRIIIFAGTTEGRNLCEFLTSQGVFVTVCVATKSGTILLSRNPNLEIYEGRLCSEAISDLILRFDLVIDATHPYASVITQNIKNAVDKHQKKFIRLVRPMISCQNVREFKDIMEAAEWIDKREGNVLITTGSKELEPYTTISKYQDRLFLRVLPTKEALFECEQKGFLSSHLICMQGPFSEDINKALLEQTNARFLVTKESGKHGGFEEKLAAAMALGVEVLLIGRPSKEEGMTYEQVIEYIKNLFSWDKPKSFSHFPLFVDLTDKKITIVGAGKIATRRINTLLKFGAEIIVVAPVISEEIMQWSLDGKVRILEKKYEKTDIIESKMVIAATNQKEINRTIAMDAGENGILVNVVDQKELNSFYFPAIFSDETIVGGMISNAGNDHVLVKKRINELREWIVKKEG